MATYPNPLASNDPLDAPTLNDALNALYNLSIQADIRRSTMWHYASNILAGNSLTIGTTSFPFGVEAYQNTAALNDEWTNGCYLSAGTYDLIVRHINKPDGGIVTVSVDDVSQGTIDTYAAPQAPAETTFASIILATAKWVKVSGKVSSKNASSTDYKAALVNFSFRQAAD